MTTALHRQVQCLACGQWSPRPESGFCPACGAPLPPYRGPHQEGDE